ncbi:linker histone H1M isoform X1 [Gasterosteus aculeatus]
MPPKKTAPAAEDTADLPPSDAPVEEKKSNAAALRKLATHPSTAIMVKEALKELDSRKGVSSQAIQSFIGQKYPSVDLVRLKHLVRRALKKGIETGTLVRPANSNVTTGATGKFRLAPNAKEAKPKTENVDPNVLKEAKDVAKKLKKAGAAKKSDADNEEDKSKEEAKPPKKPKKEKELSTSDPPTSKVAPAKRPKAKKAVPKVKEDGEGASEAPKTTKAGWPSRSKAAKAGSDPPTVKATGKRGRKTAE